MHVECALHCVLIDLYVFGNYFIEVPTIFKVINICMQGYTSAIREYKQLNELLFKSTRLI